MGRGLMGALLLGALGFVMMSEDPMAICLGIACYSAGSAALISVECSSYLGYLVFFVYVGALVVMFCMVVSMAANPELDLDWLVSGFLAIWGLDFWGFLVNLDNSAGLGVYGGVEWGYLVVGLGFILLLGVIAVANMSKRSSGSLVEFAVVV